MGSFWTHFGFSLYLAEQLFTVSGTALCPFVSFVLGSYMCRVGYFLLTCCNLFVPTKDSSCSLYSAFMINKLF